MAARPSRSGNTCPVCHQPTESRLVVLCSTCLGAFEMRVLEPDAPTWPNSRRRRSALKLASSSSSAPDPTGQIPRAFITPNASLSVESSQDSVNTDDGPSSSNTSSTSAVQLNTNNHVTYCANISNKPQQDASGTAAVTTSTNSDDDDDVQIESVRTLDDVIKSRFQEAYANGEVTNIDDDDTDDHQDSDDDDDEIELIQVVPPPPKRIRQNGDVVSEEASRPMPPPPPLELARCHYCSAVLRSRKTQLCSSCLANPAAL